MEDDIYLDNLDEFVNDENKLVTYKWLSLTLDVSLNVAKRMLEEFVKKHRMSKPSIDLQVTYIVSGVCLDSESKRNIHKTFIVTEEKVASVKEQMVEVFPTHIYSIHRAQLTDVNLLFSATYDKVNEDVFKLSKYSAIKCSDVTVKTTIKQPSTLENVTEQKTNLPLKSIEENVIKKIEEKGVIEENNEKKSFPLFTSETKKVSASNKSDSLKQRKKSSITPKGVVSLASFFTKSSSKASIEPKKEPVMKEEICVKNEPQIEEKEESPLPKKKEEKCVISKMKKGMDTKAKRKNKENVRLESDSKRRRIMTLESYSSSSSEGEDEGMDDESPLPHPEPKASLSDDEVIPSTPEIKPSINLLEGCKRMKRKLVTQTYTNENGFFVTKKELKCVADDESDNEDPIPNVKKTSPKKVSKSPKGKAAPKPKASPKKTKQSKIMSFFSKR